MTLLLPFVGARAEEPEAAPGFRVVGSVPVHHDPGTSVIDVRSSGWIILNPATRRGYIVTESRGGIRMWIESFDLDTLRPIRRESVGSLPIFGGTESISGELVHAVDPRGRVFIALSGTDSTVATGIGFDATRPFQRLLVLDEHKFNTGQADWESTFGYPAEQQAMVSAHSMVGLTFVDGAVPHVLAVLAGYSPPSNRRVYDHWLLTWNAGTGQALRPPVLLTPCRNAPMRVSGGTLQTGILATDEGVSVLCQERISEGFGGIRGVANITTVPIQNGQYDTARMRSVILPHSPVDAIADNAGNRLLIRTTDDGETWWVFDAATGAFAGAVGLLNQLSVQRAVGLDGATGRMYALLPDSVYEGSNGELIPARGGLFYSDSRLTPAPQATSADASLAYPGVFRIAVDPATPSRPRRVFVRRGSALVGNTPRYPETQGVGHEAPVEQSYLVIEDSLPVAVGADVADVDRFTSGRPEKRGVTAANFGANTSGYGARTLLVSGISGATNRAADNSNSPCVPADRELAAAVIERGELTNEVASARAQPLTVDDTTRLDMERPVDRCYTQAGEGDGAGSGRFDAVTYAPPGEEASCAGSGKDDTVLEEEEAPHSGDARVSCDHARGAVELSTEYALRMDPSLPIVVGHASSTASIKRAEGITTTVTSTARDIEIEGVGSIALVQATATAQAAGTRKTADTDFQRIVCGVHLGTFDFPGCTRDLGPLVTALNTALGTKGSVRLREPDPMLAAGSPGGYLAAVQKRAVEEFSDQIVNRDDSKAVPALELTIYNDDPSRGAGRQIVQLAGVQASSTFGTYLLSASGMPDGPDGPEESAGPASESGPPTGSSPDPSVGPGRGTEGGGRPRGVLARILGRLLMIRGLLEGILMTSVWLALALPVWCATRRAALLKSLRDDIGGGAAR